MIVDNDEGVSRVVSIDASGVTEWPTGDVDVVADELATCQPDLILVSPGALTQQGGNSLVDELNRLSQSQDGYARDPAPGEIP